MVQVSLLLEVVVAASSTVIAAAAVGIYNRISSLAETVEKHDRTLYGEENIEGWQGLVERVASHEAELREKRKGDEYSKDYEEG